tara:strand:+ start:92 stop:1009 length:918 start_codon:yes stop_codon:yes gene_type:complete
MIQIKANGKIYSGYEKLTISKSMSSIGDTFTLDMFKGDEININGNDLIQILNDDVLFFTGFVDSYNLGISNTKKPLNLAGRSRTSDLIDCMIETNQQYNNQTPTQIINDLTKPFAITVNTTLTLEAIVLFSTKVGETYFSAINRLCKQYNILPISDEKGNLKLIKNNNKKVSKILKDTNILDIQYSQDFTNRFKNYIYKKESSTKEITPSNVEDTEIIRFRPFVAVNNEEKTNEDLSNWKKNNDKANSIQLSVQVDNWDYSTNEIVDIKSEIVSNSFLAKSINYTSDNNGTVSTITFVDKGLYDV